MSSTVFISHGSPMLAADPGATGVAWRRIADQLPRPRGILVVSAHWMTPGPAVSATALPETIHDFYGFPEALYRLTYPAPGAATLANEIRELIPEVAIDPRRGLDHGAWVPLRSMYPQADVPVIQMAVMPEATPEAHFRLGQRLAPMASSGILIIGSGGLTHNLRDISDLPEGQALAYVAEFSTWFRDALERRDHEALFDYRRQAPHALRAHPSEEHLLPIFVALGAASANRSPSNLTVSAYQGFTAGALAMDAFIFAPATT
jgi:4,5-DOPA dioxygenase extradiol